MYTASYVPLSTYQFGDMQVDYVKESECQTVGLFLYPADMTAELVSRFYSRVKPIIKNGRSKFYQHIGSSWQHPQAAQAILRTISDHSQALLVVHSFAKPLPDELIVDLPHGNWQVTGVLPGTSVDLKMTGNQLPIQPAGEFEGYVIHLENDGQIEYTLGRQQKLE